MMSAMTEGTSEQAPPRAGSIWRNRDFRLIWAGQTLSDLGTGIAQLAYPLMMLTLTGSPTQAGAVAAARTLPYLLFGLVAGAFADRSDRKRVMIVCEVGNCLTLGSIPVALWVWHLTAAHLYITAFLAGVFFVFFSAAESGCLPNVVRKEQLTSAVAAQETTSSATTIVAPSAGGAMYQLSHALPFLADAVSYAVSALALLLVRPRLQQEDRPAVETRLRTDIAVGMKWLLSHRVIRLVAITAAGLQLAISGVALVVIVATQRADASPATIGLVFSAVGIGGVAGSLIAPRLKKRWGFGWMLLGTAWAQAALWLLLASTSSVIAIAVILLLFAFSMPVFGVASLSYRLSVTPDHLLSRVGTAFRLIAWCTAPLGASAAGFLLSHTGPRPAALIIGLWVLALAVLATVLPGLRNLTTPDTGPADAGTGAAPS